MADVDNGKRRQRWDYIWLGNFVFVRNARNLLHFDFVWRFLDNFYILITVKCNKYNLVNIVGSFLYIKTHRGQSSKITLFDLLVKYALRIRLKSKSKACPKMYLY